MESVIVPDHNALVMDQVLKHIPGIAHDKIVMVIPVNKDKVKFLIQADAKSNLLESPLSWVTFFKALSEKQRWDLMVFSCIPMDLISSSVRQRV